MYTPEELIRSVVYIGYANGNDRVWLASGFLVRLDRPDSYDSAREYPTYLITAKHIVAKLLYENKRVVCALQVLASNHIECDLPAPAWHLHDEQDIAIIPFDYAWLQKPEPVKDAPWSHILCTASIWYFACAPRAARQFTFSDPVHMVGLWRRRKDVVWPPIVRTGFFAAMSPEKFRLETGPSYVYMVDGTVTHGMSGGLAFLTSGAGTAENSVLGLIHGYLPLPDDELDAEMSLPIVDTAAWDRTSAARYEALRQLERDVQRMNSQIALIVREVEISNFIDAVRCDPPNTVFQLK